MKSLAIIAASLVITVIVSGLLFFAIVGACFLFNVDGSKAPSAEYCPNIERFEDGSLACVIPMQSEDDDIMVQRASAYQAPKLVPLAPAPDLSKLATTWIDAEGRIRG